MERKKPKKNFILPKCIGVFLSSLLFLSVLFSCIPGTSYVRVDGTEYFVEWVGNVVFFIPLLSGVVAYIVLKRKISKKEIKYQGDLLDTCEKSVTPDQGHPITHKTEEIILQAEKTYSSSPEKMPQFDEMALIKEMELEFEQTYQYTFQNVENAATCRKIYDRLCEKYMKMDIPIPCEIRREQLIEEYKQKILNPNPLLIVDKMDGHSFERWCASLLSKNGFCNVEVTPGSGDQGVDIVAVKDGVHYAIQCKCYSHDIGNTPIQEVYAGKEMYRCQVGVVMTNRHFTAGAQQLAEQTRVLLWDRDKLKALIESAV